MTQNMHRVELNHFRNPLWIIYMSASLEREDTITSFPQLSQMYKQLQQLKKQL